MGFEVIKNLLATPHRVYAALALLQELKSCSQNELLQLLLPDPKTDYSFVVSHLIDVGLAQVDASAQKMLSLTAAGAAVKSLDEFRVYMQQKLLSATRDEDDNFLLSLFTAWYAARDEQVLTSTKAQYAQEFHKELFPAQTQQPLNPDYELNAWQLWSDFLGCGWTLRYGGERRLMPDATVRVRPLLSTLLPENEDIPFGDFVNALAEHCPELDGGVLFQRAWSAARGDVARGNHVSLMLSTALRVLEHGSEIELIDRADATQTWTLFPAQSYIPRVTHIARKMPINEEAHMSRKALA